MDVAATTIVDRSDTHVVVGAGFVGLGMMAALRRAGIPVEGFESDDDLGGNWYHGVYETVHIISSRKTTQYGDWPMPSDWPDFPSKDQMLTYLRGYAEHHDLRRSIRFSTPVAWIEPEADGRWLVRLESGETRRYGGVIVAIGHHWDRRWPQYPGERTVELIHSKDYKRPDVLVGKRVLVIGGGNSACDIAVEAARFASHAAISLRRGYWFLPKTVYGVPLIEMIKPWMPPAVQRRLVKAAARVAFGPYERYGLPTPDHEPLEHHPTINSELLYFIKHGRIHVRPDIARWHGNDIEFTDGRREHYDLVVAATGYHLRVPFVPSDVVPVKDEIPQLIAGVLPEHYKNFYFTSFGQPRYGAGPLITAGAHALVALIRAQAKMQHPIGAVLRRLGERPPVTALADPFEMMRRSARAVKMMPRIVARETAIMRASNRVQATMQLFSPF